MRKKIAIFASGTGSNAQKIVEYFQNCENLRVGLVVSNRKKAPVLEFAKANNLPTLVINRSFFYETQDILKKFNEIGVDYVVLAGFLWLIPRYLVRAYGDRMINIHPALLPNYGGAGMYGMKVHEAVHAKSDTISGLSIHYVNENYDEGAIIFQAACAITPEDSPKDIAHKVLQLEHRYYPRVIDALWNRKDT